MVARRSLSAFAVGAFAGTAMALPPFTITPLILEGDTVEGAPVASVDKVAVNNAGQWIAMINSAATGNAERIVQSGSVLAREGGSLAGPFGAASLRGFAAATANLSNTAHTALNFSMVDTFGFPQQGALLAGAPFFAFSDQTAYSDSRFATWAALHVCRVNDALQVLTVASVDDFAIPGTSNRAVLRVALNPDGSTQSATRLLLQGDVLPGQTLPIATTSAEEQHAAWNNRADHVLLVQLQSSTPQQDAINEALYLNGSTLLAQKGMPSPVAGRLWAPLIGSGSAVDVGGSGDVVFRASLATGGPDAQLVVKNGAVVLRSGTPVPGLPGRTITAVNSGATPVKTDDAGDVLNYLAWNDPDPARSTGLLFRNEILVRAGVTTIGGQILVSLATGAAAFDISDNGRFVIFIGELPARPGSTGPAQGAFLIEFHPCAADFNADGQLNADDLGDFITCYFSTPPCPAAEFNADGQINADDLGDFITTYFSGC